MIELDWRHLPFAPLWVKLSVWTILGGMILGLMWVVVIEPQHVQWRRASMQEQPLKAQYRKLAHEVAGLPDVEAQLNALNQQYNQLIAQLPEEEELAELLAGISDVGGRHQLNFDTLAWQPRQQGPWLDAIPIDIVLHGQYRDIGAFSADIAAMTRLVSLQNFILTRDQASPADALRLSVSATTYRYTGPDGRR
ncbi:type 4a pilus biogenesis protein PilO [Salinivibrio kushneri]|uniref:Type 4a pilus biogenesis protein PilO n=1 Tax=Salinivibrio kushneri TaxID=1908198 RepID=A0AA47KL54_9GAMM|nr:type 4a pilus biogenesis protein PilO [Salinivibrio kushneri]WBA08848.1 type 4a pilus biogenesis protein PilO [Salinivibrio kushneri]